MKPLRPAAAIKLLSLLVMLFCCWVGKAQQHNSKVAGPHGEVSQLTFQQLSYIVCKADPHFYKIDAYSKIPKTNTYYDFSTVSDREGNALIFAINGGMYAPDHSPVGLFITNGTQQHRINLRKLPPNSPNCPNFYCPAPNGVFFIDANEKAGIWTSDDFAAKKAKCRVATQSGPMMVQNGAINPGFGKASKNRNIRNGVGVDNNGVVYLAISSQPVTFYEFATFFLEQLHCNNALYLDGAISQAYVPQWDQQLLSLLPQLGPIITVSSRRELRGKGLKKVK